MTKDLDMTDVAKPVEKDGKDDAAKPEPVKEAPPKITLIEQLATGTY